MAMEDCTMADSAPTAEEIRAVLRARRDELLAEVSELAQPVRAPGVQMQFGKRAGDHTADAVTQMQRSMTASELFHMATEIERALERLDDGSYGLCADCGGEIAPERLEALPWATQCISCKSAASTR